MYKYSSSSIVLVFHMLLYIYSLLKVIFAWNIIKQKREREGEGEREIYKGGLEGEIVENQFFFALLYILIIIIMDFLYYYKKKKKKKENL